MSNLHAVLLLNAITESRRRDSVIALMKKDLSINVRRFHLGQKVTSCFTNNNLPKSM